MDLFVVITGVDAPGSPLEPELLGLAQRKVWIDRGR